MRAISIEDEAPMKSIQLTQSSHAIVEESMPIFVSKLYMYRPIFLYFYILNFLYFLYFKFLNCFLNFSVYSRDVIISVRLNEKWVAMKLICVRMPQFVARLKCCSFVYEWRVSWCVQLFEFVWFILRPCQHDDGYIDGRSHADPHPRTDTGSQRSVFPDGHPSKY